MRTSARLDSYPGHSSFRGFLGANGGALSLSADCFAACAAVVRESFLNRVYWPTIFRQPYPRRISYFLITPSLFLRFSVHATWPMDIFDDPVVRGVAIFPSPVNRVTQFGPFPSVRLEIDRTGCLSLDVLGGISVTQCVGVGEIS